MCLYQITLVICESPLTFSNRACNPPYCIFFNINIYTLNKDVHTSNSAICVIKSFGE